MLIALFGSVGMVVASSYESLAFANYANGFGPGPSTKLYTAGIVPNAIDFVPYYNLFIYYSGGIQVYMGDELTADEVVNPPTYIQVGGDEFYTNFDALYTIVLIDLDGPTPDDPYNYQYLQWCVINVPASDLFAGTDLSNGGNGTVLAPYKSPYTERGIHRYVFVVNEQRQGKLDLPTIPLGNSNRRNFSLRVFARQNHFYQANAANYFISQPGGKPSS